MLFKKALLLKYAGNELDDSQFKRLDKVCEEKVLIPPEDPRLESQLKDTDCLLVKLGAEVKKDLIDKAPKLKYIGMFGTGYGRIDTKYAASKGITVCNVADYATEAVAEFAFGILLEYLRHIERAKAQARGYNFDEGTYFNVAEIKGLAFGIIGLGHIGARTAEIAKSFGAEVKYWSRNRKAKYEKKGIEYTKLDKLLRTSDVVSINLSKNDDTVNFLNKERIQEIKSSAVVINLSPMELVDLDSMLERLERKELTFILDHSDEMPLDQINKMKPLMKPGSNLIVYPPVAYTTKEASALKKEIFISDIESFAANRKPKNKVN